MCNKSGTHNTEIEIDDEDVDVSYRRQSGSFEGSSKITSRRPQYYITNDNPDSNNDGHGTMKAAIALLAPVSFVTPQNWKCQPYTSAQNIIEEAMAPKENVGLIPTARLPFQQTHARINATMVWPIAAPGCPNFVKGHP